MPLHPTFSNWLRFLISFLNPTVLGVCSSPSASAVRSPLLSWVWLLVLLFFFLLYCFRCLPLQSVQKSFYQIFVVVSGVITVLPSSCFCFLHIPLQFCSSKSIQLLLFPYHTPSFRTLFFSWFFIFSETWNLPLQPKQLLNISWVPGTGTLLKFYLFVCFPPNFIEE